ncbi:hypothetical protein MKZ18_06465 [Priestia sp. FSL W8-0001]|uniref:hypothetical protein n=1 Tax=unclassified Priestia TaxID=2800374 RepID=UPI0030FACBD1
MKPQDILRMSEIAQYDIYAQGNIKAHDKYIKQLETENKQLKQRVESLDRLNQMLMRLIK